MDSPGRHLEVPVPTELIDAIAERVADIILDRLADGPRISRLGDPGRAPGCVPPKPLSISAGAESPCTAVSLECPCRTTRSTGFFCSREMNSTPGSSSTGRSQESKQHSASRQSAGRPPRTRAVARQSIAAEGRKDEPPKKSKRTHRVRFLRRSAAMSSTKMSGPPARDHARGVG